MSRYKLPLKVSTAFDATIVFDDDSGTGVCIELDEAARDLTAYYELLAKQAECGNLEGGHCDGYWYTTDDGMSDQWIEHSNCPKCGADLTKGATHG